MGRREGRGCSWVLRVIFIPESERLNLGDWEAAAEKERFADAVIIATPDRLHKAPAVAFAQKGYSILLEKPMAVTPEDCQEVVRACQSNNVILSVCHVLQYHPVAIKIKPKGAASRCLDCVVEESCPYSAKKIYLERGKQGNFSWPVSVVCSNGKCDIESLTEALRHGPYGRCVYECDNDVVTNQVVNMEFEGGATAAFTMIAFTKKLGERKTTIYGTKVNQQDGAYPSFLTIKPFNSVPQKTEFYHPLYIGTIAQYEEALGDQTSDTAQ
ncbi:hypothetical protein lerEdw1_019781 [Lerista edwardsae]|nr:hypothetical protein lerEdw1_019781 [Lerista edwardsae]